MLQLDLAQLVQETAIAYEMPGVAVGVWADHRETYAFHGVTSIDNPLPVDRDTLYALASISKTYTATAVMRLVVDGRVDLDAPVRQYIPELTLADEQAAATITVLQLLNHTSGLGWDVLVDTGDGDDALAAYVARLADLELVAPPGERASYSQAGYSVLGRLIERVVGVPYEAAIASLIFEPAGLSNSFFTHLDVMTRRFVVGHTVEGGTLSVSRVWRGPRCRNPGGGVASSAGDLLKWGRVHLGDGSAEGGAEVLPAEALHRMKDPTVQLRGSTLGDSIGIGWFLGDVGGVRTVGHGGGGIGQYGELVTVPEHDFAVVSLSNAGPEGYACNQAIVQLVLETYLGVKESDPETLPYDQERARELVGTYENDAMTFTVTTDGVTLTLETVLKPEVRAGLDPDPGPDYPPAEFALLPGGGDEYIVTTGGLKGQRGFFSRDKSGAVVGVDLAGRLFPAVETRHPASLESEDEPDH